MRFVTRREIRVYLRGGRGRGRSNLWPPKARSTSRSSSATGHGHHARTRLAWQEVLVGVGAVSSEGSHLGAGAQVREQMGGNSSYGVNCGK
jgi:hypothetical protein